MGEEDMDSEEEDMPVLGGEGFSPEELAQAKQRFSAQMVRRPACTHINMPTMKLHACVRSKTCVLSSSAVQAIHEKALLRAAFVTTFLAIGSLSNSTPKFGRLRHLRLAGCII